jgi:hypothetical protein
MAKNMLGNKGIKRNRFDDALSARIKVSPRNNSLGDPLNTGVNIAQQDLNNAINIRNEHDDDAELFTNLSKIAGDKPEGAAALFTGLMEGATYGAKTKSTEKKQEALSKYDRVMDYLRKVNAQAMEMKEWHQKRDFAQQKYMPQVLAYAENVDKLDPQSQRLMAQSILDGWNRTTGDSYKLDTIDGADPFIMTVSSKDGAQVIDVRDLFAGDEVLQQKLAMKMPEYQMKLQEERAQKAFDNEMKERQVEVLENRVDIERENAPVKYKIQRDRIDETARRNDQNAIKSDIKLNETLGKKIDASREFLARAPKIDKIVKEHPDIFQSAIDAVWRESKEPGFTSNMLKAAQNKLNPEKVKALTVLIKDINKMTLDVANGFSRPNMFIEKIGSKAVPNLDMNAEGFSQALGEMVEEKRLDLENNQRRLELFEQQEGKPLSQDYQRSTADVMGNKQAVGNKELSGNVVTVVDPETGQSQQIDESFLDAAIAGGWERTS